MYLNRSLFAKGAPVALVTLLLAAAPGMAAETGAEIRGRVLDAANRPVVGAAVTVKPGNLTLVTDPEGGFATRELAPGHYTLEVLYMGAETWTQKVQVEAGKGPVLTIKLVQAMHDVQVVTVTATRLRGEVEALNQERNAQDIVNVIPADVITSLPNANVADAVGRLPSVSLERDEGEGKYIQVRGLESKYTSVTVNGVRVPSAEAGVRQIKLDAYPSDLLGSIELHKTQSADQEGDGIGGTVNLVTKIATDIPFFSVGAELGYNNQGGGRYSGQINGTWTQRFGTEHQLGVVAGATYDYNGRTINDIEPSPAYIALPSGQNVTNFQEMDIRDYRYYRHRWGAEGGLDYKIGEDSVIYFKGFYSEFEDFGDKWVTSVTAGNFLTATTTDNTGGYTATVNNRRPIERTYSYQVGGKHDLKSVIIDYSIAFSHSQDHEDNQLEAKFNGPSAAFVINPGDGYAPQFIAQGGVNYLDPSQYPLHEWEVKFEDTDTKSQSYALNFTVPHATGEAKFGFKYRFDDKSSVYNDQEWKYKGSYTMANGVAGFTDPDFYTGIYPGGPFASLWAVNDLFNANPSAFNVNAGWAEGNNLPNDWDVQEKVTAAYLMDTLNFSHSKLNIGARLEHTSEHITSITLPTDASGNYLTPVNNINDKSYDNVLPSVSWRYEFDQDTLLRLAWGMALCRPDYDWMVPSVQVQEGNGGSAVGQVITGNPNLKITTATCYDAIFEHYMKPVGLLSAGVFYKSLQNAINLLASNQTVPSGPYAGYSEVTYINSPSAYVYGLEAAWKQHLTFLPGYLAGLGTDMNFTLTRSEATFDPSTGRTGSAPLQRTAPVEANFGLTYDWKAFTMRLAATYNSAMIFQYNYLDGNAGGISGPNGDTYLFPHTQVDVQASYSFLNGLKLTASALNLTNAVFGFYNGSPQYIIQREFYNRTFTVGLKYRY